MNLTVADHPLLDLQAFVVETKLPLVDIQTPPWIIDLLSLDAETPFDMLANDSRRAQVKAEIRDMLRRGGYKPTGRGKPASEYLVKAVGEKKLSSINPIVDTCNVVSLHSGVPISVVDLANCTDPLRVEIAPPDSEYVFNMTGQTIKLDGLICLFDAEGPCANGVKDSQRTKTSDATQKVLTLVWGSQNLAGQSFQAGEWFKSLIESSAVGIIHDVVIQN